MLSANTADPGQNPLYQYRPVVALFVFSWEKQSEKRTEFFQSSRVLLPSLWMSL